MGWGEWLSSPRAQIPEPKSCHCIRSASPLISQVRFSAYAPVAFYSENLRIFEQRQRSCTQQVLFFETGSGSHAHPSELWPSPPYVSPCEALSGASVLEVGQTSASVGHVHPWDTPSESRRQQRAQGHVALCTDAHRPWLFLKSRNPCDHRALGMKRFIPALSFDPSCRTYSSIQRKRNTVYSAGCKF